MITTRAIPAKTLAVLICGVALVTLIAGAAHVLRGPERASAPEIHTTTVLLREGRMLNVQTREVTVAQWQACHRAGACELDLSSRETGAAADYPATGLSYLDAMEFIGWMNGFGRAEWRLPDAAEWQEIAAEVLPEKPDPIFTDPALTWASAYLTEASRTGRALRPSGAFSTTSAGIEDLDGNVWEWTRDCYAESGGGGGTGARPRPCPAYVTGGEHEAVIPFLVRDPARGGCAVGAPPAHLGMRLVSDVL